MIKLYLTYFKINLIFGRNSQNLLTSRLTRVSILMGGATLIGGVLGYVFQVIMGRLLPVADYGLLATLMAVIGVIGVPLGAVSMMVSRQSSWYLATGKINSVGTMYWKVNKWIFWISVAAFLLTLPVSPLLKQYFGLASPSGYYIFILATIVALFSPVNSAVLQAKQDFRWLALNGATIHGFKIVFCSALVLLGFRLNGALMGLALAAVASWLMTYVPIRSAVSHPDRKPATFLSVRGAVPVLLASLSFAVMVQLDMLLVKHYFEARLVGLYAAAAVMGKAVMYLPTAIAVSLFPMVADNESRSESSSHLLLNAIVLTFALSGTGALIYYLYPREIITLLYGPDYRVSADVLRYFGFAMLPMSLIYVAENFLIAKGRVVFAYLMMIAIPFILYAVHVCHDNLVDIVYILGGFGWVVAFLGFGIIGYQTIADRNLSRRSKSMGRSDG